MNPTPPSTHESERVQAARRYLQRGFQPVPVPAGVKGPRSADWNDFRCAAEDVGQHFGGEGNIGLLTGKPSGGLVDVDLDCEEAISLAEQFLPATGAETGRASTPRSHRWYIAHDAANRVFRDPYTRECIVELRGDRLQTLVGPSVHPETGERYEDLNGTPTVVDAGHLLDRVAALARAVLRQRYGDDAPRTPSEDPSKPAPVYFGEAGASADDHTLKRASAYLAKMPPAIAGQGGHNRAYAAATCMVHGFGLTAQQGLDLLWREYNPRCEPPWSVKELEHKVNDAASKPHALPYGWLRDARPAPDATGHSGGVPAAAGPIDAEQSEPLTTDLANARLYAERNQGRLAFCHELGKWLVWDGRRWLPDDSGAAIRQAQAVSRELWMAAASTCSIKQRNWATKSQMRARIEAMVELAKSDERLVVRVKDLDAGSWLLNTNSGTIDLRTGELRPHSPGDWITKLAPVDFDYSARSDLFTGFLNRIFDDDEELIGYVQRVLGMSLTGDISEQYLFLFHGGGANGKSVLLDTIRHVFGDYASEAPPALLISDGRREHPTEIADLLGRRLVVASETEQDGTLDVQRMKKLTGDQFLKGRFMRQDFFEFPRTHKLVVVTNNKPRVREQSHAVWRRLRMVPFQVTIPVAERDPGLLEKLKAHAPAILAWLVQGCRDWQEMGLHEPECVRVATDGYRDSEDQVGRFMAERCRIDVSSAGLAKLATPWQELWKAYSSWATDNGEEALTVASLRDALDRRGHTSATRRVGQAPTKVRVGLILRSSTLEGG